MKNRPLLPLFLALLFIALLTAGIHEIRVNVASAPDYVKESTSEEVLIDIAPGATGSDIANMLFNNGVVKSSIFFPNSSR